MEHFAPQVSIVTGGANGIGRALAQLLVERGGHVVIADLDLAAAMRTAAELEAAAPGLGSAQAAQVDVADGDAVRGLVADVAREHHRLDFMANNAGRGVRAG